MKSNRVNGFLVVAIVLAFVLLAGTVYGGMLIFNQKTEEAKPVTHQVAPLGDVKSGDEKTSIISQSIPFYENRAISSPTNGIPNNLIPQLLAVAVKTGIPLQDYGYFIHNDYPKLLAVGVTSGIHEDALILTTDHNLAVLSPLGLYIDKDIAWNRRDYPNLLHFLMRWQDGDGTISGNTGYLESLKFDSDGNINWTTADNVFSYSIGSLTCTPRTDEMFTLMQKGKLIPTLPPLLYLGIVILLLLIIATLLWKMKSYDMSIACFTLIPAVVMVGGLSIFLTAYIPAVLSPMASFLASGILWSVPLLMLWSALGLERALGLFWLSFGVLFAVTILDLLFPFVWLGMIGVMTILVIVTAIMIPTGSRDIRL